MMSGTGTVASERGVEKGPQVVAAGEKKGRREEEGQMEGTMVQGTEREGGGVAYGVPAGRMGLKAGDAITGQLVSTPPTTHQGPSPLLAKRLAKSVAQATAVRQSPTAVGWSTAASPTSGERDHPTTSGKPPATAAFEGERLCQTVRGRGA